ncbi:MAG: hypothetical protein QM783_09595 [Phycisphaerales bacterium]
MNALLIALTILALTLGACASNGNRAATSKNGETVAKANAHKDGGNDEGDDETDIAFDQMPAAVKTTANARLNGATVKECSYEDENGRRVYTVELSDGRELEIAADGSFIKEDRADEDNDHEDHDDNNASAKRH